MSQKAPYESGIEVPAIGKIFSGTNYADNRLDFKHPPLDTWRPSFYISDLPEARCPTTGHTGTLHVTTPKVCKTATTRFDRIAQSLDRPIFGEWSSRAYQKQVSQALTTCRSWVHPLQAEIFIATVEPYHKEELERIGSNEVAEELTDNQLEMLKHFCRWWFFPIISNSGTSAILHAVRNREGWSMFTTPLTSSYPHGTPEDGVGVILKPKGVL